jgi:hypothetical protein
MAPIMNKEKINKYLELAKAMMVAIFGVAMWIAIIIFLCKVVVRCGGL